MPSQFPESNDNFTEPSSPETTPLSSAGSGTRAHVQHHRDLGDAIEAIQSNVALTSHDHSGGGPRATAKLRQANTHEDPDTDTSPSALHHTLGTGPNQAARGNHTHQAADIVGAPMVIATSTTRPASPHVGLLVYETDTNRIRVWAQFPGDSAPRWVLLPIASKPIIRLLQGERQRISPSGSAIEFRTETEDTFGFFNASTNMTEVVIGEPGLYDVDGTVAWTNTDLFSDWAMSIITLNGQETSFKHQEYIRGRLFTPGRVQDIPVTGKLRCNAGDRIGLRARHNGASLQFTASKTDDIQTRLNITYESP